MNKLVVSLVVWLKGEPVVAAWLVASALTLAAHFGLSLSVTDTTALGIVLTGIGNAAARSHVSPKT